MTASYHPPRGDAPPSERLAAFDFFASLTPPHQATLQQQVTPCHFPKGTSLLTEGDACEALLLIERGTLRIGKSAASGREITLYNVGAGESCILGTSCILGNIGYPAQAVVESDVDALAIPAPLFRQLFDAEAPLRHYVMELFSRRLAGVMALVEEVAFRRMDERLAAFLLPRAERGKGIYAPIELSHEEIAGQLGTAREVVSRLLQQFAVDGLVRLERRRILIADAAGLQRLAATK